MSLDVWTQPSGYLLGSITTTAYNTIQLPVQNTDGVTFAVIAGKIPRGMELIGSTVSGVAFETLDGTTSTFCIRASKDQLFADRTFYIEVTGYAFPVFNTHSGILPIGINGTSYVIEGTIVDFKIEAVLTIPGGPELVFSLIGSLPPGLILTQDGFITGTITSITQKRQAFTFTVAVTNASITSVKIFTIIVVKPSYLSVDNNEYLVDSLILTSDCTAVKPIEWITPEYLGFYVYDNYVTLHFNTVDETTVTYNIEDSPELPPGTSYNQSYNMISGYIPQLSENRRTYTFSIIASRNRENHVEVLENKRTFYIDIVEKSNGILVWMTDSYLGAIDIETPSLFSITAVGAEPSANMIYTLESGSLPPGLVLNLDGTIEGKVSSDLDLFTSFDEWNTIFDSSQTTFDRVFSFVVKATDQIKDTITNISIETGDRYGVGIKQFSMKVNQPLTIDYTKYANITVQPLLNQEHRLLWRSFINDHNIFNRDDLYKADDDAFGVQIHLSMLVYSGIEAVQAEQLLNASLLNHKRKRFQFGELSTAVANDPTTNVPQYEVVYVNMIDPLEEPGKVLPLKYQGTNPTDVNTPFSWTSMTRMFSDEPPGSEAKSYYPSSLSLWRSRLNHTQSSFNDTVVTNSTFLPLWMKTFQPSLNNFIGYKPVIPLCYCKVGSAEKIALRINQYFTNTGFSLSMIDYTVDRYIVSLVLDDISPKYFIFRNEPNTI